MECYSAVIGKKSIQAAANNKSNSFEKGMKFATI